MKRKISALLIIMIVTVIFMVGCGTKKSAESKLVGKWQATNNLPLYFGKGTTVEFLSDSTVVFPVGNTVKYTVVDDNNLKLGSGDETMTLKYELKDNELKLYSQLSSEPGILIKK